MRNPTRWLVACLLVLAATRAEAFPAFARKYGMSCTACHLAWPIFNQVGQSFWDNGYQFNLGKDDPINQGLNYIPISLRTTPAYTFTRTTNQPSDNGPVTTQTGGVPLPPGVDILTGGTIAKDLSFLLVLTGFSPVDNAAFVESAWVRVSNLLDSSWLNFKIGKFELDQPASAHRNVTLTTGYAAYSAHPAGSVMSAFDIGTNQVGVELAGHSARSTTRYALDVVSANGDPGSANAWSSPLVWAHVQQAFELDNAILPWVRVGALGGVGWWPTQFATTNGGTANIPGTGTNHKSYQRAGGELSWMLGYPSTPAFFTAAYMYGREEAGLAGTDPGTGVDLSGQSNSFHSGFFEVDWVPWAEVSYNSTPWLFFARYDWVRYQTGSGNYDGGTVGARRYLALGPKGAVAIHAELHADKTRGTGAPDPLTGLGKDVESQSVLIGLDFDF